MKWDEMSGNYSYLPQAQRRSYHGTEMMPVARLDTDQRRIHNVIHNHRVYVALQAIDWLLTKTMTVHLLLAPLVDRMIALRYRLEFLLRGRDYRMPIKRATRLFAKLFERQLRLRGIAFDFDEESGTYRVDNIHGFDASINLSNVAREFASDGDTGRVTRFARNMLQPALIPESWTTVKHKVLWEIHANTLAGQSDLAFHLSDQTHQTPVIFDPETSQILFLESRILIEMSATEDMVEKAADVNLADELRKAEFIVRELEGVRAAFVHSEVPFKASLILSRNLREIAEPVLGWPLYAVIPNRDRLHLFAVDDFDGVNGMFEAMPGLGAYVLDKYENGAYPISTEIFEITDKGVKAVAEYSRHPPSEAEAQSYGEAAGMD